MSSLTIQELALDFMHTCSRPAQDKQRNSEKHLEVERLETQINSKSENQKQEKDSGFGLSESVESDKHFKEAGLSDHIQYTSEFEC